MTEDIAAFIRAQLDAEAEEARAVRVPPDWHQGPGDDPEWTNDEMVLMWPPEFHTRYEEDKHWRGLTVEGVELAAFIARRDPARALAEVDAKRRVLARHQPYDASYYGGYRDPDEDEDERGPHCRTCGDMTTRWPCGTLRDIAAVYREHPGYRPEWAPDA